MRTGKNLSLLAVLGVLALLLFVAPNAAAQDAAQEMAQGLNNTEISFVNPFTGQGTTVTLFRVLYVIAGAILLVIGWRAYKVALGIIGFVVGSSIGAGIAAQAGGGAALTLLMSLAIGIIGVLLAVFAYYVAIAVFGGYIGYLLTGNILLWLNYVPEQGSISLLILLTGAILGGALALALSFELIVLLTSYLGAVLLTSGLGLAASANGFWWLIGLFIAGVAIQIGIARSINENVFERRRYA